MRSPKKGRLQLEELETRDAPSTLSLSAPSPSSFSWGISNAMFARANLSTTVSVSGDCITAVGTVMIDCKKLTESVLVCFGNPCGVQDPKAVPVLSDLPAVQAGGAILFPVFAQGMTQR